MPKTRRCTVEFLSLIRGEKVDRRNLFGEFVLSGKKIIEDIVGYVC